MKEKVESVYYIITWLIWCFYYWYSLCRKKIKKIVIDWSGKTDWSGKRLIYNLIFSFFIYDLGTLFWWVIWHIYLYSYGICAQGYWCPWMFNLLYKMVWPWGLLFKKLPHSSKAWLTKSVSGRLVMVCHMSLKVSYSLTQYLLSNIWQTLYYYKQLCYEPQLVLLHPDPAAKLPSEHSLSCPVQ